MVSFLQLYYDFISSKLTPLKNKSVLDIGCGDGELSALYAQKGARVTAIDIQKSIKEEYKKLPNLTFKKLDASKITYNNAFDYVVSFDVIEHIQNDKEFVKRSVHALKKGGTLLCGTPFKWRTRNVVNTLRGRPLRYPLFIGIGPYKNNPYTDYTKHDCFHIREYTFNDLRMLFEHEGCYVQVYGCWLGLGQTLGLPIISTFPFIPYQYLFAVATKQ